MELKLEKLTYQEKAIQSVVKVFDGNVGNTYKNANHEGIRSNICELSSKQIQENIQVIAQENGIEKDILKQSEANEITIEMETGTGKTLVYLKTIYELYQKYGFTKFIILVPSVAIRQGVLGTFRSFNSQLENVYGFKPNAFEYDSKRLNKVADFIKEQHPQVMIMTLASFNSEDKILNQVKREDLYNHIPFIEAVGKTNPIMLLDEPQEGMDTDNSIRQINKLNPLFKIRYSATHKVVKNLIYRLTPYDSYKEGLVKKIEVLTVTEKNDEASLKIELCAVENKSGKIQAKFRAWHQHKSSLKFEFKETGWMKEGDNLGEKTNNPSYLNYRIERLNKNLKTERWFVQFSNDVLLEEKQLSGNLESIWAMQLEWLIRRHFQKSQKLKTLGIKCLSLIFIDRVANYMGENPIIKGLFIEKYKLVYAEFNENKIPTPQQIQALQGYYFAQKSSGEYADNEGGVKEQAKIYELILKGKEELLTISNPVQFIFSHSALGVGWDNPNIFNIATLNTAFSEVRKRQEIGRGLRLCVNQDGQRIRDDEKVENLDRINQLTIIPNESYETFVTQYQAEIKAIYGTKQAGAAMTHTHKNKPKDEVKFKLNRSENIQDAFKKFWGSISQKTEYTVRFNETNIIKNASERLNFIVIPDFVIESESHFIHGIGKKVEVNTPESSIKVKRKTQFSPSDLIEELSENTGLSYATLFQIVNNLSNYSELIKNPPKYIHEAISIIREVESEEIINGLKYHLTGENYTFNFQNFIKNIASDGYVETPNKGIFDKILVDNEIQKQFCVNAEKDPEIVCFLKLPNWYQIQTPFGEISPDFGVVMKRKKAENDLHFVIVVQNTNHTKNRSESETNAIKCAKKYFEALAVEVSFEASIKDVKK
jgi:type III restriction enzyme